MQLLYFITLHAQRERGKVIGAGVHIYVTVSEKRYIVAHIFKIELLAPRDRVE